MQGDRPKNYLHLHIIVFIWGFTAVLGKLISLDALPLVWYRMSIATLLVFAFAKLIKVNLAFSPKTLSRLLFAGLIIALHWYLFFLAIKVSNISITLACMSCGAFFASILETVFYGKKLVKYELILGIIVILALSVILYGDSFFNFTDTSNIKPDNNIGLGIAIALVSSLLSTIFAIINGSLAKQYNPVAISFYELGGGVFFISLYFLITGGFTASFFTVKYSDLLWLFLLGSVCTAYTQIAAVKVMKYITPYTMMLTINLEPVYGIIIALAVFNKSEHMGVSFYVGTLIILCTVIINGVLKNNIRIKK